MSGAGCPHCGPLHAYQARVLAALDAANIRRPEGITLVVASTGIACGCRAVSLAHAGPADPASVLSHVLATLGGAGGNRELSAEEKAGRAASVREAMN